MAPLAHQADVTVHAYACGAYIPRIHLQEAVAPFALENLGCAGNETRLVDCPVDDGSGEDDYYDPTYRDYTNSAVCDPYRGSFAEVACGTDTGAGVSASTHAMRHRYHHTSHASASPQTSMYLVLPVCTLPSNRHGQVEHRRHVNAWTGSLQDAGNLVL